MLRTRNGRTIVSFAALVVSLGAVTEAQAAPKWLRLSYTGDTTTTMTVAWNTDGPEGTEVRYGTASGARTRTASGTSFVANGSLGHVHEVTITGLEPDTQYFYSVGSDADGYSAERAFSTGPAQSENCASMKFVFLGDNRPDAIFGGGENWPNILGQSLVHQPDFVLSGGDLVVDGEQIDEWKDMMRWTASVASSVPFMPCIGNHDTGPGVGDGANYNQLYALPRSTGTHGSGTEDYYYFTYGNAIFVALTAEAYSSGSPTFADQAAWLDNVLTNNLRKWKFVFYHKPSYTHEAFFEISHSPNEEGQNAAFVSVIDKHHVDVVFNSHNHWYERFEPSACGHQGSPSSNKACPVGENNYAGGTVYYVSGGAGAFTIPGFLCGTETGRAMCSGDHHYLVAEIQNEVLKIDTWSAFPQANQVIDSITITKSADNCTLPPDAEPDSSTGGSDGSGGMGDSGTADTGGSFTDGRSAMGGKGRGAGAQSGVDSPSTGPSAHEVESDKGGCGCRTIGGSSSRDYGLALLTLIVGVLLRGRQDR